MADITGTESGETLDGTAGDDTITALGGDDTINAGAGNDTILPGSGKDTVNGEDGDDRIILAEPSHLALENGMFVTDTYNGGAGTDTLEFRTWTSPNTHTVYPFGPAALYVLPGTSTGLERLVFTSTADVDIIVNASQALISAGITEIVGGAGSDALIMSVGFSGTYTMPALTLTNWQSSATPHLVQGDIVFLQGISGQSSFSYTLNALEGLASTQYLIGGDGTDTLNGSSGVEILNGLGGTNTLNGGGGNDVLQLINATLSSGAVTTYTGAGSTFNGDAGFDVFSIGGTVSFEGTLSGIEAIHLQPEFVSGFANNWQSQVAANLVMTAATMATLPADLELQGTGFLTVNLAPGESFTAAGFVHAAGSSVQLYLNGSTGNEIIYGSSGGEIIDGRAGNDLMVGGAGDDTFIVDDAGDLVFEYADEGYDQIRTFVSYTLAAGQHVEQIYTSDPAGFEAIDLTGNELGNTLIGNAAANTLTGNGGNDALFGGTGGDTLIGGTGDDTYFVDEAADVVTELADGGYDSASTSISHALAANVERLFVGDIESLAALHLTGNDLANDIVANAGDNLIDGGAGADSMFGAYGNDIYFVDNAGDQVLEGTAAGYDTVFASVSFVLDSPAVERVFALDPSSTAALNFTGNALDNELGGTAGANILDGGLGADLMVGADGDDIYFVDNAGDVVSDSPTGGYDTVFASISFVLETRIERVVALDPNSTAALSFTGNSVANEITGNAGGNLINGGGGADILFGGAGADAFLFTSALGGDNIAALPDFAVGQDRIYLDDAVFSALTAGALSAGAFHTGAAAADADDRIVYDSVTGALYYDADGNGAGLAVQFASLHEGLALSAGDFQIV